MNMAVGPDKKILIRYILNSCTPEERVFVEEWRDSDPDIQKELDMLKLLYISNSNPVKLSGKFSPLLNRKFFLFVIISILLFILAYVFCLKY